MVAYLCIRQYGKGVLGSLAASVRRIYRPAIALLLLVCSGTAYAAQPLVDQSNPDEMAMTFYEVPYAENVVCTGQPAAVRHKMCIRDRIAGCLYPGGTARRQALCDHIPDRRRVRRAGHGVLRILRRRLFRADVYKRQEA